MAAKEVTTIQSNSFAADKLVLCDAYQVPTNSPLAEAIRMIKRYKEDPRLKASPVIQAVASSNFEVSNVLPAVDYSKTPFEYRVTLLGKTVMVKLRNAPISFNPVDEVPVQGPILLNTNGKLLAIGALFLAAVYIIKHWRAF